jgi:hypothetical protein
MNIVGQTGWENFFRPEGIDLFIEDQAFSPSYDLAPPPLLSSCIPYPAPLYMYVNGWGPRVARSWIMTEKVLHCKSFSY